MGVSTSKPREIETKWFHDYEKTLPSLEGKDVCITGCTTGTGYIVARTAIRKGAQNVFLLNRNSSRATQAEQSLKAEATLASSASNIVTISCDLQDLQSVEDAITTIKSKLTKLDVLCNNAGVMALEDKPTKDGYDVQMQTNHLSHFLLTKELYPLLKKAVEINGEARVCNHSSEARRTGKPLEKEYFGKNGGNLGGNGSSMFFGGARWVRYSQTKLANSVFSLCLAEHFEKIPGLISACAHPGLSATNLQVSTAQFGGMGSGAMWIMYFAQSPEDGSMPILAAAFDSRTKNGDFWGPKGTFTGEAVKIEYEKGSKDERSKKVLWEASEEAFGKFDIE